ncbi:hypothetical protein FJT64_025609 [Amphibalanus amphitrite]|uniref:PiggyBac transposable element-derived protein domain-containing protein n=1 Tax=Amphibalanus amphitrite TaxID=1232801 RepID=A0A6A4WK46_AMPAM|nr:hypothetical protein FJT64_025609 [Amphibalanus amphitrite]
MDFGNIMRGSPGPKGAAKDVNIPKDAFGLFLPDSLLTQILERSNEEGERLAAASNRTHIPVTLMELRAFIGLVLLRGCEGDRRCKIDDLFYGPFSRPFYRATMTKNRFVYIKRILRKLFLRELGLSLVKPLILLRPAEGLTMKTRAAIENVLGSRLPAQPQPRREPTTARARCATCVADQQGAGYKRSRHTNVNKVKSRCCKCTMPVCRKHSKRSLPLCNSCDAGPSGVE